MRSTIVRHVILVIGLVGGLVACVTTEEIPNPNARDGGTDSRSDIGEADTGEADTGEDDTSEADTSEVDISEADISEADTGEADTGEADTGEADTGEADTGETDTGEADRCADVDCSELVDACTSALCDPESGDCVTAPNDDGTPCAVGGCLTNGVCDAGACVGTPVDDGTECDDDDPCTLDDACTGGLCAGVEMDCSAFDDACASGACDPETSECTSVPVEDGTACEADRCITGQTCADGVCEGGDAVDCTGTDTTCSAGVCDPSTGRCTTTPRDDVTSCDDGNACTTDDLCLTGVCSGTPLDCAGLDDACNVGVCDAADGRCIAAPVDDGTSCDDGDACTTADACVAGVCGGADVDCSGRDSACEVGLCNAMTGACDVIALADGTTCDDGDGCTTSDTCTRGTCAGTSLDCTDGLTACQSSSCDPDLGACGPVVAADLCSACPVGVCGPDGACVSEVTSITWGFEDAALPGTWASTGDTPWQVTTSEAATGAWSLASGDITDDEASGVTLTTAFTRDVQLSFALRTSTESGYDYLRLFVDGTEVDSWSGTTAWTTHSVGLPAGPHVIEWRYTKDGSLSSGADTVWIDDVRLAPPSGAASTFAAWDFEGSGALPGAFTSSGDASWSVTTATSRSGTASAVAGGIGNSQTTSLQLVATWPADGAVTFAYSVSSEADYDFLEFWVDGARVARWSGGISWTTFTHDLASGDHTLEWRYDKDISLSVGSDTGWIDDVELTALSEPVGDLCSTE